jgi:UDP-3-O-[3-hydroxymyristoyl] glucosamine N-acyltransferase
MVSALEISKLLKGELSGNGDVVITSVSKIDQGQPNSLTFLSNPKYTNFIYETKASVVLVNRNIELKDTPDITLIKVDDPYSAFCIILDQYFNPKAKRSGIEQPSFIAESAKIGKDVYVGAFAYIGNNAEIGDGAKIFPHAYVGDNAKIGKNTILYSGVKVYEQCMVGDVCIIHAGSVVGSDGFGFAPQKDGTYAKIPQIGNVIIEDNVEIGSNCSIDRATMGSTFIRKGVKLDNLIQVAHNAEVGANTVIASQTGVSGSTKIGENCVIGGQVGFVGHISIAKGSQIGAQSGIPNSIDTPGEKWIGSPVQEYKNYLRSSIVVKRLPDMEKRLHELEHEMIELRKKIKGE